MMLRGQRVAWVIAATISLLGILGLGCSGSTARHDGGVPCSNDLQCGIGEYCKDGFCVPFGGDQTPQTCTNDLQCQQDEICEGGVCVKGSRDGGGDGADLPSPDGTDGGADQADTQQPQPKITLAGDVSIHQDQQGKTYQIDYGNVSVGVQVTRKLVIRNTGDADLLVSVITLDQDPQHEFSMNQTVPPALQIAPGANDTLVIAYQSTDGLTIHALAKVFSNDPTEGEIDINLISEFKGQARITVDPLSLEFGDLPVATPKTLPVQISNQGTGNAVLRLDSVIPEAAIANAYTVGLVQPDTGAQLTPPVYLNNGDVVRADVTFNAPARNTYQGDLIISSDDPISPTTRVAMHGRAGAPSIVVDPTSIDFGQVPTNTQAPDRNVKISNKGVGDLHVSSIDLAPGHSPDLSLANVPAVPLTLAPAGEASFQVRYAPTQERVDAATLVIVHDDPDHQPDVRVDIGGQGVKGNAKPTAVIKANGQDTAFLQVKIGDRVDFDGTSSFDSDGTVASYQWRIVKQPTTHPCGQDSVLSGVTNPTTFIILREAGLTTIGLTVTDNQGAQSAEDTLDLQVGSPPVAKIWVGGNTTGYVETDLGMALTFDGSHSTDCDGSVTTYQWSILQYPAGRGSAPAIQGGPGQVSVLFDFPGNYRIGLVVGDNDVPQYLSTQAIFDILVKGPKAFRVTADWFDEGNSDNQVDVDLHLLKPGSTNFGSADDCFPGKPGKEAGNPTPDWGSFGQPRYQKDSWEDLDGIVNPNNPADEIDHTNPGMGNYGIYVYFRCHYNFGGIDYNCCDDGCSQYFGCPWCPFSCQLTGTDYCVRKAVGEAVVYITDFNNVEHELVRRGFNFTANQWWTFQQIGTLSWPDGNFQ